MVATVIEVRRRGPRKKTSVAQLAAQGGEVAVTVKKPSQKPHRHRNIALVALAVAVAAIAMSVIATWIALGRVSQHSDKVGRLQEERSWCGVMGSLSDLNIKDPDPHTQKVMAAIQAKYASLHCPASTPSAPPHAAH